MRGDAFISICLLALTAPPSIAQAANPYGVAGAGWQGAGVMIALNMPTGTLGYLWDDLDITSQVQMIRPMQFWKAAGLTFNRPQGYDVENDRMYAPTLLATWVLARPGKIWIIGNEPNVGMQDNLTPAEYARMFKASYDFIHSRDATARFVGAGLAARSDTGSLMLNKSWWDEALSAYRTQFGTEMPIDIWNCHGFGLVGSLDPERAVKDFFKPFQDYVNTVSSGRYAGVEIWCTELGIETWTTPLHPDLIAAYVQQMGPRLEQLGISRIFWDLGPWAADESTSDLSLLTAAMVPTALGQVYRSLANTYPHNVPVPSETQQPFAPLSDRITCDFSTSAAPLRPLAGAWSLQNGAYRQTRLSGPIGLGAYLPRTVNDVRVAFDVKINAVPAGNGQNWVGVSLRGGFVWKDEDPWGYTVWLKQTGDLGICTHRDGIVASVASAVSNTSSVHRIDALLVGSRVEVRVDGVLKLTWTDPNARHATGIVTLRSCVADCAFDNLVVSPITPGDYDRDGAIDSTDIERLRACHAGPGRAVSVACRDIDLDADGDIDQDDFGVLQRRYTGSW